MKYINMMLFAVLVSIAAKAQTDSLTIGAASFASLAPSGQNDSLHIPSGFRFQYLTQRGDAIANGDTLPPWNDFTGYVPISGSSRRGFLSINSEYAPGGVTVFDVSFDAQTHLWSTTNGVKVDFSPVLATIANCSGTVTPWNTVITCEERVSTTDYNNDGYYDAGWAIEIDPATRTIVGNQKLWALGNFAHENACVHPNRRTVYQGADSGNGYLYKFVADTEEKLTTGKLYVYKGSKNGSGKWLLLNNTTINDRNTVQSQCANLGATIFSGIEDVEYNPLNGWVYLAVKNENVVYRFLEDDAANGTTVSVFETFVGGRSYTLPTKNGSVSTSWGTGNDNLAFDNEGNLWVLQDGSNNYLWVVGKNHTQANPDVRIFMRTPAGGEPTGITFSPDFQFLFMSIQHPSSGNAISYQTDVGGKRVYFNKDVTIAIARDAVWRSSPCVSNLVLSQTPASGYAHSSDNMELKGNMQGTFTAGNAIELTPGFTAESGSVFKATIGGCQ